MSSTSRRRPVVSVILATFNEHTHVHACISSLLDQDTPDFDLEILAIDGNSTDGTREILEQAAAVDRRVRVLTNVRQKAPFAFNMGLLNSVGEYVCIFGAHTTYAKNYIAVCLDELIRHRAGACGGRVMTHASHTSIQARLVACVLSHPFGSSRKSFRTQSEGFVDTVNYAIFLKQVLTDVGGYNEALTRNQDNDVAEKIRARGFPLFCTWKTTCFYHPTSSIRRLIQYAYRNGFWNVISWKANPSCMAARHFVPFFFVLAFVASLPLALCGAFLPVPHPAFAALPLAALFTAHLCAGTTAAVLVSIHQRFLGALWLPFIFLLFHMAYGFGTLVAFVQRASTPQACPTPLSQVTHER